MTPPIKDKKVLVVDDDSDILNIMNEVLTYEGYEVSGLKETDNIFPEIMSYRPDIVILDYILQGVNGGELCHQIKINPHTRNIPVILMSAYPKVLNSLGDYGCDLFIAKPFNLDDITNCVEKLVIASQTHYVR